MNHPALSLHSHWAWAVLHAGKRVENRTWRTSYRGWLWIHATVRCPAAAAADARVEIERISGLVVPEDLPAGAIVGAVRLVDCVVRERPPEDLFTDEWEPNPVFSDPWATGPVCWVLTDPRPLATPVPCTGRQQLWYPPADVAASLPALPI